MDCRRKAWIGLLMLCCAGTMNAVRAQTMPEGSRMLPEQQTAVPSQGFLPIPVPLDQLAPQIRERVRSVLERPTLASRGPLEAFHCRPALYYWLLDHPDQAVWLWRGLGAKCTGIEARGDGGFTWKDAQNGEVHWHTIVRTTKQRVWYAEGPVRPGVMLPSVPIRVVVVLTHQEGSDSQGKPAMRHQMEMFLHTDSRAVRLATRLFGASAPRLAEEYIGQLEMFFGALAWYLSEHPDKATALFEELKRSNGNNGPQGPIMPTSAQIGTRGNG